MAEADNVKPGRFEGIEIIDITDKGIESGQVGLKTEKGDPIEFTDASGQHVKKIISDIFETRLRGRLINYVFHFTDGTSHTIELNS